MEINILTDALPRSVSIGGVVYPINWTHDVGVGFDLLVRGEGDNGEKIAKALTLFYPRLPADIPAAVDAMTAFFACGKDTGTKDTPEASKRAYCFKQDAELIYSAFRATYGIDLNTDKLHWWAFVALFKGLPPECEIKKAMYYRTVSLNGLSKNEKKRVEKMRKIYALTDDRAAETVLSIEDREAQYIAKMHARLAERQAERNKAGDLDG